MPVIDFFLVTVLQSLGTFLALTIRFEWFQASERQLEK